MKLAFLVLVGLVTLGGIYFMARPKPDTRDSIQLQESGTAQSSDEFKNGLPIERESQIKRTIISPTTNTNTNREEIEQQIHALADASAKSDSDSFHFITNALDDERHEIRQAAVEAAIEFGNRDAIPVLKELAAKTEDPREKVEILDAIEFLALPSFNEARQTRRTNSNPGRIQLPPK